MPIQQISLGVGSARSRYGFEGDARLVNCYAENLGNTGKVPMPLYAIDGLTDFASLSDSGVRAMLALESQLYAVVGRSIVEIDPAGSETVLGGIIGDGLVTMARNRASTTQVGICVDGLFKIVQGGVLSTVTDTDLPPANSICHLDGYFILTIPDGRFFITSLNDGTAIDALDFAKAEANPDGLVRGFSRGRDLLLFGNKSLEAWGNTGGEDFPFTRTTSIEVGCLAPGSVATVDQTVGWIAHDGTVRLLNGYQANKISDHGVERAIDEDADPSGVMGFSWQRRGHTFYALTGTTWTWVYDLATGLWHERESVGYSGRWRCSAYAKFGERHVFGDVSAAKLYTGDPNVKLEGSESIIMTVQTPIIHAYPNKLQFNRFFADIVPGQGLNTTDVHNSDPQVMISYSEDGGHTWSGERFMSIGELGARKKRVVARRLGLSGEDGRMFRLRISADVVSAITGAAVDVEAIAA